MQHYTADQLFGRRLSHIVYEILLKTPSEHTVAAITDQVLTTGQITFTVKQKKQLQERIYRRLKDMARQSDVVECLHHVTLHNKTPYNTYQINLKQQSNGTT